MCRLRLSGFVAIIINYIQLLCLCFIILLCVTWEPVGQYCCWCCCPRILPRTRRHLSAPYEIRRLFVAHVLYNIIVYLLVDFDVFFLFLLYDILAYYCIQFTYSLHVRNRHYTNTVCTCKLYLKKVKIYPIYIIADTYKHHGNFIIINHILWQKAELSRIEIRGPYRSTNAHR